MASTTNHEGDWHHVDEDPRRRRRHNESEVHPEAARQPSPTIPTVVGPINSSTFAETAGKILDLKGLLRPPSFTGLEKD